MPLRILSVATLMLAALLAAAPAQAQQATGATSLERAYQSSVLTATNRVRASRDLVELRANACVRRFAVRQARRMAARDRMFHQDLGPILTRCGLRRVAENVAYGYATGAQGVWQGWMRSPGHRANILGRGFRLLGTGARRSDDGTWYAAQVFGRRA